MYSFKMSIFYDWIFIKQCIAKGYEDMMKYWYYYQDLDFLDSHTEGFHLDRHAYETLTSVLSRDCLVCTIVHTLFSWLPISVQFFIRKNTCKNCFHVFGIVQMFKERL